MGRTATLAVPAIAPEKTANGVMGDIRRHSAGLIVALVLASTLVLPRWWVIVSDPSEGVRVPISPYGAGAIGYDETLYTSSIRQAYDGQIPVSDPYLETYADDTPQRSAAPHELIGIIGRVTGDTFSALALITTIAALAALVALYVLLFRLTGSRLAAVALIPLILMAIHVVNHAEGILPLRHKDIVVPLLKVDPLREVHAWTRFPSPILLLAPFFAGVIAFPRAVETGDRRWMAAGAVLFAIMIYAYSYYWTAFGLALALWLVAMLASGRRQESARLVATATGGLLLALPELVVLAMAGVDLPADARDRVGLEPLGIDTAMAMTVAQRLLVGAPFLAALAWRRRVDDILYVALFLAPLILVSVTGVVPQTWHYHTQIWAVFAIPACVAGGAALFAYAGAQRFAKPARVALAVGAVLAGGYVITLQARAVAETDDAYAVSAAEDAAFAWIRANLDEADTIVSPSITTNLHLASLSPAAQYLSEGGFSVAEDDELAGRILRAQAAFGLSESAAFSRMDVHGEDAGFPVQDADGTRAELEAELEQFLAFFTFSFEITDQNAFRQRTDSWRPAYRDMLEREGVLAPYPADYLYCGHRERALADSNPAPGTYIRRAFSQGDVAIYQIVAADADGAAEFVGC